MPQFAEALVEHILTVEERKDRGSPLFDPAASLNQACVGSETFLGMVECRDCTVAVIGGAPLDGPRYLLWNFVSSSKSRLQRAADDWRAQRLGSVAGETEFIPLPENMPIP